MRKIANFTKERLREPSTYAALSSGAAATAVVLQQVGETIAATGSIKAGVASLIFAVLGVIMREKGN